MWMMVLFLFLILAVPVHGYASWLKCYVELDEEEVVMHHFIVPSDKAREEVFIEVQQQYQTVHDGTDTHVTEGTTTTSEWSSGKEYQLDNNGHGTSSDITILRARLMVPPSMEHTDVQYVMEVTGGTGAQFIDIGVMCDGRRAFSRRQDEYVTLQINPVPGGAGTIPNDVELVAVWATGFEAVTLTPKMTLRRIESPSDEQEL